MIIQNDYGILLGVAATQQEKFYHDRDRYFSWHFHFTHDTCLHVFANATIRVCFVVETSR